MIPASAFKIRRSNLLWFFPIAWFCGASPAFSAPNRVAVLALAENRPAPALADSMAVLLSKNSNLEILERADVDRLLEEGTLMQCAGNESSRPKLGRLLDLDYFINIKVLPQSGGYVLELVDGLTGKISAFRKSGPGDLSQLAGACEKMIEEGSAKKASSARAQVAVLDFEPAQIHGIPEQALALRLGAQAREKLSGSGLDILDRSIVGHAAREQIMRAAGETEGLKKSARLLKSDFVVSGKIENGGLTLRVLDMARSSILGTQHFALELAGPVPVLSEKSLTWLLGLMGKANRPALFTQPVIQPEALQPFYEGLAFYQAGRYLDAIDSFSRSYRLSDKFQDAYLWEGRCYEALGLKPLGGAMHRFALSALVARGVSRPVSVRQTEGITFAGIEAGDLPLPEKLRMELAAVNALTQKDGLALQLPSDLAKFCDEYDTFVGVPNVELKNWSSLPNLLTRWSLRGTVAEKSTDTYAIEWRLLDTLSLAQKKSGQVVVSKNSKGWEKEFAASLEKLLQGAGSPAPAELSQPLEKPSLCAERLQDGGSQGNRALLQLVLQQPEHPALWGRKFDKNGNDDGGLQGFLNAGLREYLIQKLPPSNDHRKWLELVQLRHFLPYHAKGPAYLGKNIDVFEALQDFKTRNRGHITAAVAEYMLLWENLSKIPGPELRERLRNLERELGTAAGREQVANLDLLAGLVGHLETLAALSASPDGNRPPLPGEPFPRRMIPVFKDKKIEMSIASEWICNEWLLSRAGWLDSREEARAALYILGRGSEKMVMDPQWLKECPHSIAMLSFALRALHEVDGFYGRPIRHPFDAARQREEYLQLVDYCVKGITHALDQAATVPQADFLGREAQLCIFHLTHYAYHQTLGDARFESIRQELGVKLEAAMARAGKSGFSLQSLIWMRMPRVFPDPQNPPPGNTEDDYRDPAVYRGMEEKRGKESWAESPVENSRWSRMMEEDYFLKLPPAETASILAKYEGRMEELFNRGDLNQKEIGFVLNYALQLFHARRFKEAEKWFEVVTQQPETDLTRYGRFPEYKANAAVYIGYIRIVSGRESEAVPLLKEALAITNAKPKNLIVQVKSSGDLQYNNFHEGSGELGPVALRLLDEARLSIQPEFLPANVLRLAVPVPKLQNTNVPYYVRVPKGYSPGSGKKYGILVLFPSVNHNSPDYCFDDNPWAKFADAEGLFLISPQLQRLFTNEGSESDPRDWSGDATLKAVSLLSQKFDVQSERLLLHGYGAGATFVEYFARWKPERVAAVSSHSSTYLPFYEWIPGLKPLSSMKDIPHFLSCGQEDDANAWYGDRCAAGIQYATALKDAGVPLVWKSWPDTGHVVSPGMETMAQAFLAYHARRPLAPPEFMGDLRTWTFVPAGSPSAPSIPLQWRQPLPSREIAEMWGEESK